MVSDKKDDESAVMEKSASGWGAKKSFAAILKEKKAAAAERRASSDDEDSKPKVRVCVCECFLSSLSIFVSFSQGKVFEPSSCFPLPEICGLDTCIE